MNTTFQAKQIIINEEYNKRIDNDRQRFNNFEPYMKHETYRKYVEKAMKEHPAIAPFVIEKTTKCFVYFRVNNGNIIWKKKINNDERGQYFIYDNIKIYAHNTANMSIIEKSKREYEEYAKMINFARKTIEIEDSGYTYVGYPDSVRVETIEQLKKEYNYEAA